MIKNDNTYIKVKLTRQELEILEKVVSMHNDENIKHISNIDKDKISVSFLGACGIKRFIYMLYKSKDTDWVID